MMLSFWSRRHPISDEELNVYVDSELDAGGRARVEAHVEGCAACRETVTELRAVRQGLAGLPRVAAPRSFALRDADVRPREAPRPVGGLGRASPVLGGVAMVAFLAFWVLVGVDVAGGPSERAADTVQYEAETTNRDAAPAAEATGPAAGLVPTEGEDGDDAGYQQPPAPELPATGPVNEPTESAGQERASLAEDEGGDSTTLRAGEAAAAAVALVAGGSLALVWWRRRA